MSLPSAVRLKQRQSLSMMAAGSRRNTGISTGVYTEVDGYRYVNIVVEFEQKAPDEEPLSLGVMFAHGENGKLGSRRYFTFDQNFTGMADPQMITVTGKASWHGHPHDRSSYIARLPRMGPFLQVFPFNHYNEAKEIKHCPLFDRIVCGGADFAYLYFMWLL